MGSSILNATEVEELELLSRQQGEAHRQFRQQEHPRGEHLSTFTILTI